MRRKHKKPIFNILSRTKLKPDAMNFIQISVEQNMLILKTNDQTDQLITLPLNILQEFLSSQSFSEKLEFIFNKKEKFCVFDLLTNLRTPTKIWNDASVEYFKIMQQNDRLTNDENFLFFSHFLRQFEEFNKNSQKCLVANLDTFSKMVVTTGSNIGTEHIERFHLYFFG